MCQLGDTLIVHVKEAEAVALLQVLQCLHSATKAVCLRDPLLRVSVGLRLALHLEAGQEKSAACDVIREVSILPPAVATHVMSSQNLH